MNTKLKVTRDGVAATEFAVALPVLMLLTLACADFGRVMHYHEVVSNAARTGAEAGAMHKFTPLTRGAWETDVREAVTEELANLPDFDEKSLDFKLTTTVDGNDLAIVRLEINYPFERAVSWPGLPHVIHLRALSQVRQFR